MIGDISFEQLAEDEFTANPTLVIFIYIFVVLVSVCMLNMLIAMMGDTYEAYKSIAGVVWQRQRIMITMSLEQELDIDDDFKYYDKDGFEDMVQHVYHVEFVGAA